jgi:hypothetical protein
MDDYSLKSPDFSFCHNNFELDAWVSAVQRSISQDIFASMLNNLLICRDVYSIIRLENALRDRNIAIPDDIDVTLGYYHARALMLLFMPARAVAILKDLAPRAACISSNAEQVKLSILLAGCQLKAGHVEAGLETLAEAEQRWPDDDRIIFARLELLARSDPGAALALLRRLEADPTRVGFLSQRQILRGDVLISAGLSGDIPVEALATPIDDLSNLHALVNVHAGQRNRVAWADAMTRYLKLTSRSDLGVCLPTDGSILTAFGRGTSPARSIDSPVARLAVIMYVHNAAGTLLAAISSVLAQSYEAFRLVIVDDGSTDGSGAIMRAIAATDPRISIIENPVSLGLYRAKNLALRLVASDIYTFHDAETWMHPERLDRAMSLIISNPRLVCVYSQGVRIDLRGQLASVPRLNQASVLVTRCVLDEVGDFDWVRSCGDAEFEWRLRAHYGSAAIAASPDVMTVGLGLGADSGSDGFVGSALQAAYAEGFVRWHLDTPTPRMTADIAGEPRAFPAPPDLTVLPSAEEDADPFARAEALAAQRGAPPIVVWWPMNLPVGRNWGDKLNAPLVAMLAERPVINARHPDAAGLTPIHFVIGSGLRLAGAEAVAWGTGFIGRDNALRIPVEKIHAVRGPLTAERIVEAGGASGLPMGDPALLLPLFYNPDVAPRYDIGIIQHFREAGTEPLPRLPAGLSVRLIDITGGIKAVIDAVLSCRRILSSSLHGLIVGHAYGVPATWLKISDRPLGDDFKFHDYWASIGRSDVFPVEARDGALIDPEAGVSTPGEAKVDLFALLAACPFIDEPRRQVLIATAKARASGRTVLSWHAGLQSVASSDAVPSQDRRND